MGNSIDCSLEVIEAAKRGKIDLNKVEAVEMSEKNNTDVAFNLQAYNCAVHKNRAKLSHSETGRMLHISEVDRGTVEPYGVPESVVTEYAGQADEYEKLVDRYEFQYAVSVINGIENMLLTEHSMNFWCCMRQALRGIPGAVAAMKRLVQEEPDIGELVWIILSSGMDVAEHIQPVAV
ncbi:MAG: hypothetical protein K2H52_11315 [Lachnospiraceae bacterium]|nr:hypothetical protein [Lachnospiraceae bacterium]